ncbi:hypothetical protein [Spongiimicrobium sp. 3-5]|uniref:hypothetical protein n=1 Tax=Spongiimicrobium sp. 3-5 TaxID=3332596 RepID=UPI003980507B
MQYLSKEIEALVKSNNKKSLVKKQESCGIFQDYGKSRRSPPSMKTKAQNS